jgi:hypothetical protein
MPNEFIVKNGLISQGNITVSGSITATGGVIVSGSIASASYAANADLLDGLNSTVFTLTSSFNDQTASFTAFTSSMNSFSASINTFSASILTNVTALNAKTASFATTGSNTFVGAEVISGSLAISGSGTPFTLNTDTLEITGSLLVTGSTTLTGSLLQLGNFTTTGTIIAQTINVQTVTSSIVYSSGSNVFGNSLGNSQTFTGSVLITGSLTIAGASSATSYNGSTIFGSTIACSPIGCFATSCATSFIGGTMSGTTIYGSTAVCSPVGLFSGCVGIGTVSPGTRLEVVATGENVLKLKNSGGQPSLVRFNDTSTTLDPYIGSYGNDLAFGTYGGGEKMRITNGGNLGIGCTTPGQSLTVQSAGVATYLKSTATADSATYGNFQMYRQACKVGNGVGFALGLLNSAAVDTEYAYIGTLIESCTSTQECGAIGFYTTTAGNGRCERLRITSTGNVGIGTTGPTHQLHVVNSVKFDTGLYFNNSAANGAFVWQIANESLRFGTCDTERMRIINSGNVGIGATSPAAKLHTCTAYGGSNTQAIFGNSNGSINSLIYDTVIIQADDVTTFKLVERNVGGVDQVLTMTVGDNSSRISTTCANPLQFFVGGSPSACGYNGLSGIAALTITCAGNVGIGTASPASQATGATSGILDVSAATGGNLVLHRNGSGDTALFSILKASNGTYIDSTGAATAANNAIYFRNNDLNGDQTSLTTRLTILSGGNIGIGTTSPSQKLEVVGNIYANEGASTAISVYNASSIRAKLSMTGNEGDLTLYGSSANATIYLSAYYDSYFNGGAVFIHHPSNVGEGKLRVSQNGSYWNTEIRHTYSTQYFMLFRYCSTGIGSIVGNGSTVAFNTSSDYRLKEDLKEVNGLEKIAAIKVYNYKWKNNNLRMDGVLAHELSNVLPYAVTGEKDALDKDGNINPQGVDYSKLAPVLVKAIQEQQCTICSQASMINILKTCLGII